MGEVPLQRESERSPKSRSQVHFPSEDFLAQGDLAHKKTPLPRTLL